MEADGKLGLMEMFTAVPTEQWVQISVWVPKLVVLVKFWGEERSCVSDCTNHSHPTW